MTIEYSADGKTGKFLRPPFYFHRQFNEGIEAAAKALEQMAVTDGGFGFKPKAAAMIRSLKRGGT